MDPRHPGPHLAEEIRRRLARLPHLGIAPATRDRPPPSAAAGRPPSAAELQSALTELDRLLESNPPPGSAAMARLEDLAGFVAMHADAPAAPDEPEPGTERR
jgi:hypothetical protein